jgi:hypothetical protein
MLRLNDTGIMPVRGYGLKSSGIAKNVPAESFFEIRYFSEGIIQPIYAYIL